MIELFTWPTPNGQKIQILLEEIGVPYRVTPVNILSGEQFAPDFLAISPNNKIPAIVDDDAAVEGKKLAVFETGAILIYLAEKYDAFLPTGLAKRTDVMQWLLFQCSGLGPMLGQATFFRRYAKEDVSYAVERYTSEATRLYGVLDRRLAGREWIAGDTYSIADIATFPWACRYRRQGQNIEDFSNVKAWLARVSTRPAVKRGMDVLKDVALAASADAPGVDRLFNGKGDLPAEVKARAQNA
jgi:GST-like protein